MSITNPEKPDNYSFLQCAEDFFNSPMVYKIPQLTCTQLNQSGIEHGFLYEYTNGSESFTSGNLLPSQKLTEHLTMFLLINAAIEGEI
jgi:hypothetical protein